MEVLESSTDFRSVLRDAFVRRSKTNPNCTLRNFAKYLGLSPATLSGVLNGKRTLSVKRASVIADQLDLPPSEASAFVEMVALARTSNSKKKAKATEEASKKIKSKQMKQLNTDTWQAISDWYHGAILEMTHVEGIKVTARTASNRLKCTYIEAADAIERLKRLGLLEEKEGRLVPTESDLTSGSEVASSAIRRRHLQILQKAKHSIMMDPIHERDFSAMTMAIDSSKLPEAKRRIKEFRRELCAFLEDGKRDRVYELAVQLFPLM